MARYNIYLWSWWKRSLSVLLLMTVCAILGSSCSEDVGVESTPAGGEGGEPGAPVLGPGGAALGGTQGLDAAGNGDRGATAGDGGARVEAPGASGASSDGGASLSEGGRAHGGEPAEPGNGGGSPGQSGGDAGATAAAGGSPPVAECSPTSPPVYEAAPPLNYWCGCFDSNFCEPGSLSLDVTSWRFSSSGSGDTLVVTPNTSNIGTLTGAMTDCPSGSFEVTKSTVVSGCCAKLTLAGTYTGPDSWSGTLSASFCQAPECGCPDAFYFECEFIGCSNKSWAVSGTR